MPTLRRPTFIAIVFTLGVALPSMSMTLPAHAERNNGAYQRSSEAFKKQVAEVCQSYKQEFDFNEREADKRSGTKAAKQYADKADDLYSWGQQLGCSWAQ